MMPLMLLLSSVALADEGELWTEASAQFRVADDWKLGVEESFRLHTDPNRGPGLLTNLDVAYRTTDWLSLGLGYRVGAADIGKGTDTVHRVHVEAEAGQGKDLEWEVRARLQHRCVRDDTVARLRAGLSLDRPVQPVISAEGFFDLRAARLDRVRLRAGVRTETGPVRWSIDYQLEQPTLSTEARHHIIGLGMKVKVDLRRD